MTDHISILLYYSTISQKPKRNFRSEIRHNPRPVSRTLPLWENEEWDITSGEILNILREYYEQLHAKT